MKKIALLFVAVAFVLSACGSRTEDGDSGVIGAAGYDAQGEPITGETVQIGSANGLLLNVRVISSTPSLLTGGQETADITVAVTDERNLPVVGLPVTFSTTGGVLQNAEPTTDDNGEATALLSLKYDSANQDIIIKVDAGSFQGSARVVAEGSSMVLTGDESVVPGNEVSIEAKLTAGDDKTPLANEVVVISSSAGNTLSAESALTDPRGKISVVVGTEKGADTITFSALKNLQGFPTVVESHEFMVSDSQLRFAEDSATELVVNAAHEFVVNWSFANTPVVGKALTFTATAGQIVGPDTITTDDAGNATVSVLSSIAGEVTVFANAVDGTVSNKHSFDYVGDTPDSIEIASSSSRVNARDSATIVAQVKDANGNPVKNTTIIFSSDSLKGGQLSTTTSETNTNGEAEITFTAGSTGTEEDEIIIDAKVLDSDVASSVKLTVVEPVLNVTLGSSNELLLTGDDTQYGMAFVVQVADGGGQALKDAQVQLSITPVSYFKGHLILVDSTDTSFGDAEFPDTWTPSFWAKYADYAIECPSEDTNGNRILDAGEDVNNNGSLDPQDPALILAVENEELATLQGNGVLETDVTGSGYFRVVYPVTNAGWSHVDVVARAQALGVEATDTFRMRMPVAAEESIASNTSPANYYSPNGSVLSCTNPN